ncbi:MAG: CAP domain-containing protein, partial [Pseudomonadota bacterium]
MSRATSLERYMLRLVNDARAARGLGNLRLERDLNESAEDHSAWMLRADRFSHTGARDSTAAERMERAGFDFDGDWRAAENLAWTSLGGASGFKDETAALHQALMNSPDHRDNILDPKLEYIGIGIVDGVYRGDRVLMITQNFAATDAPVRLDLGAGAKTAGPTNGPDMLSGTRRSDTLAGKRGDDELTGGGGDDRLSGDAGDDALIGGKGRDHLIGGSGRDRLEGGAGNDRLDGGRQADALDGGAGEDRLRGGAGQDQLAGGRGDDQLSGGGGRDVFVFDLGDGQDAALDFGAGATLRCLRGPSRYEDLRIAQIGRHAVVEYGDGADAVTLRRVDA